MKRRQWFSLHSWAGIQVCLLLSLILVTGTLATVSRDIDWLFNPAIRAELGMDEPPANWSTYLRGARGAVTDGRIASVARPADPWFNAEAVIVDDNGRRSRVFLDRYSGAVTGTGRWFNWQRFFRQLHRHLMMPIPVGVTIVCLLVIPLSVSLVSSFYIYKHWYRYFFRWPRLSVAPHKDGRRSPSMLRKRRKRWGELHKFAGLWSLWFIALMVVTSLWYLGEQWGLAADYPPEAPAWVEPVTPPAVTAGQLDTLVTKAQQHYPGLRLRVIYLPDANTPYIRFRGQADALLVRNRANQVVLSPVDGELLSLRRGEQLDLHQRISEAADPLHFGTFGDGLTRWLWFCFGVLLSGLSITGVYLQALRLRVGGDAEHSVSWLSTGWQGMGKARWPMATIVAVGLVLAGLIFIPGH